ncbi:MAG: metalloregulator ArsR/SmtB family transcription factor [Armatimonadota bacterium]
MTRDVLENETGPRAALPGGTAGTILRELASGERTVSQLVQATGLSQPNVSNHLARMRERGHVLARREGRQVIYAIASAGLAHFIASQAGTGSVDAPEVEQVAAELLQAVLTLREEEAIRVAESALARGLDWKTLYLQVLRPALVEVGDRWERGELTVAAEHLITGMVLRLIHRLSLTLPFAPGPDAPSALVACVEGELHTVGGRMVADFLQAEGWRVWYLNGYLPLEHLMEAVHRHLPDVVVLSVSNSECAGSVEQTLQRLTRWRGEQPLPLLVAGGRYFEGHPQPEGLDLCGSDIDAITTEARRRVDELRGR